ncbi:MAG TPA: hypothetical protein VFK11_02175 [Candidatus Saccharimonadales bacterium]|nr:hypothetical protein [Candidatus Saccharimonadales bacterium]
MTPGKSSITEAKEALRASIANDPEGQPTGEEVRRLALAYIGPAPVKVNRAPYWLSEDSRWGRGVYMLKTISVSSVVAHGEELITLSHKVQTYHRTRRFTPDIKPLIPVYADLGSLVFDEKEAVEGTRQSINLSGKIGELASDVVFDSDSQRVSGVIIDQLLELPDDAEVISPSEAMNRELQTAGIA